jgi:hypothetical protein
MKPITTPSVASVPIPQSQVPDRKLSEHFSLSEFLRSETAESRHIDMTPSDHVLASLEALCIHVLEPLRALLGTHYEQETPLVVTSGYRPPALNAAVGGVPGSQHLSGEAADLVVPRRPVIEISRLAAGARSLPYDQCIHEFGRWTHISYAHARGADLQRHNAFTIYKGRDGVVDAAVGIEPVAGL